MFGIVVAMLLCSSASAQEYTDEELVALEMIREADWGVTRVYLDAHQFYFELPADLVTPEHEWRGALLWRYDGQEVYTDPSIEPDSTVSTFTEPDHVLTGLDYDADAYFGVGTAERTDRYGRRWVLDYVDVEEARRIHEENDAANAELNGGPELGVEPNPGIEYNPEAGTVHQILPTSWDTVNCSGADKFFDHNGNGSFTEATATPMNDRQRKIVFIVSPETCSGTMVDSDTVLTAAHCITNSSGTNWSTSSFTVCTMENLDENTTGGHEAACFGVTDVDQGPNWVDDDPLEMEHDYGLLHLDGVPGNGWMELSSASDGTITGPTDFHRAYPGHKRNCTSNAVTNDSLTTVDTENGRLLFSADGEIQGTPSGWIKWDTSTAKGASGGPHFYCPNAGGCSNGHFLTGVQSGIDLSCPWDGDSYTNPPCASGHSGGPKARDIETWVDNNM